jgi:hypothetical protein
MNSGAPMPDTEREQPELAEARAEIQRLKEREEHLLHGICDALRGPTRPILRALLHGTEHEGHRPRPRRRELSPEFLAAVLRRHRSYRERGFPPTAMLAQEEQVTVGAVKHWLRKARENELA